MRREEQVDGLAERPWHSQEIAPDRRNSALCRGRGAFQRTWRVSWGFHPQPGGFHEEAAATGATTIAVGCPFCLTMMTDASKQAENGIKVRDVAEIIAERLEMVEAGNGA